MATEKYRVIGPFEVAGKSTGEIVELDPEEVHIPSLIEGGHIEALGKDFYHGGGKQSKE